MYRRILLAYDGSREGRAALREGALVARRFDARLFLLCVIAESAGMLIGEAAYAGALAQSALAYRQVFDEGMARLKAAGLQVEGEIREGGPAETIATYAREIGADLVVVGHRKRGALDRWWSGGTGAYLLDHVQGSLLIAQHEATDEEGQPLGADPRLPR
jgi:nucleotide-binding universal stress UspA family protein